MNAFYTKYIKRWVKSLASAIGGAIAGLLINWAQGTTPIPTTQKELTTVLIAAVLPALVTVFAPTNKITQKQLDKDPNVHGGVVLPDRPLGNLPTGTALDGKLNLPTDLGTTYPSSWQS